MPVSQKQRILLVDDNPKGLLAMQKLLERSGYEVETADTGESALASAAGGLFDVIILDIQLPDMNGYEVAYRLRNTQNFRKLLIALTGYYGRDEDKLLAQDAGFDYYLTRPVLVADIKKLFTDYYDRHSAL
jgi:two-component system, chemotaxis family, CheB/CheR fusion protein